MTSPQPDVIIIGAGPSGLWCAEHLAQLGHKVAIYDGLPSPARKFLRAGIGGLNLTHSEDIDRFIARFGPQSTLFAPWLRRFGPKQIIDWANELGADCFIGTSGRVFPRVMKASPLLRAWLQRLDKLGVTLHLKRRVIGLEGSNIRFQDGQTVSARAIVLALGGASWPQLGSDGAWHQWLNAPKTRLLPANGGFKADWSDHFRERFQGQPVKSVALSHNGQSLKGEFVITGSGIEGSAIYALSRGLRDDILAHGTAILRLDLKPDWDLPKLTKVLETPRGGKSTANFLSKVARLSPIHLGLLNELARPLPSEPRALANLNKGLEVKLIGLEPLDRAISTAGGVSWDGVDDKLMSKTQTGLFFTGEMLDWEAPTGGYLLTGCFALAHICADGIADYLKSAR